MAQLTTRLVVRLATATALALLVLTGCAPTSGEKLGDGRLIASESVYPGPAGPLIGDLARSDDEAAELWEAVGLPGDPPQLDGEALVVVAGGEPDDCRWRLEAVAIEAEAVRLTLDDSHGIFGNRWCDGSWEPAALAVTVPADGLADDASVKVDEIDGLTETAAPVADRPDPVLWEERELTDEHLDRLGGCHDGFVDARAPGEWLQLTVRWREATSRTYDEEGFEADVALPHDDVSVSLRVGSHLYAQGCSDMVESGRPLVAAGWTATAGSASIRTWLDDGDPRATLLLRDVTLEPRDDTDLGPWRIDELDLEGVPIGGVAG